MNVAIPIRLIAGSLCFLYLILPIPFTPSIREVLGLAPISTMDFFAGSFYSLCTFIVVLFVPGEIVIRGNDLGGGRTVARAVAWLTIFLSIYFFGSVLSGMDTLIYIDKGAAHLAYEELNFEFGLRLKYNVLLCLFLAASICGGMRLWGGIFFLAPTLLEVIFSKHNYATHLLIYLFIITWNSRISRKAVLATFAFIVSVLLGLRFTFYADFQNDPLQSLAVMLGEFTISWQSIPAALSYSGGTFIPQNEWYSDVLSRFAGLEIGLAGNPVAEAIFYFQDLAGPALLVAAIMFVMGIRASRHHLIGGLATLVLIYYMRDTFRTGWSLGFSVYMKSVIIFGVIMLAITLLRRIRPPRSGSTDGYGI